MTIQMSRPHLFALTLLLAALSISFFYGWMLDDSKPIGGLGWADQSLYTDTARLLGSGSLPARGHLHYQMGYPLLGAIGYQLYPSDPFLPVSFALLIGSATFIFLGARRFLSIPMLCLLFFAIFGWDLHARSFNYPSELFAIPWNNQVLFFAFSYFFWVLSIQPCRSPNDILCAVTGAVVGLAIATREESILFLAPLALLFLFNQRAGLRGYLLLTLMALVLLAPHLFIKTSVLGSVLESGRSTVNRSYLELIQGYVSFERLLQNLGEVVYDSDMARVDPNRNALLEASPWLWLSLPGLVIFFARKGFIAVKLYLLVSLGLLIFYLSGENVSAHKLKFHCLRYISPSLIALNFGALLFLQSGARLMGVLYARMKR